MGLNLIVALQIANLNANAGQMFSAGASLTTGGANAATIQSMAGTLMTNSNSGGTVMLTEIDGVGSNVICKSQTAIQIGAGPQTPFVSRYAPGCAVNSDFTALMPIADGQIVYLAESYFDTPYPWVFATSSTPTGIYVKAIY